MRHFMHQAGISVADGGKPFVADTNNHAARVADLKTTNKSLTLKNRKNLKPLTDT